ncbi:MAG: hypothetical protein H6745_26160 [Deltaproteobacteria bacterium]|nr:hypothetical protein [Deltaproteobacteria bacterium]
MRRTAPLVALIGLVFAPAAGARPAPRVVPVVEPVDDGVETVFVDPEPLPWPEIVPLRLSLVPGLSLAGSGDGQLVDGFAFGLVADRVEAVRGVQLTFAFGVVDEALRGVQISTGANVAGGAFVDGAQIATGANVATADFFDGAQVSVGANVATGLASGAQVTVGLNVASEDLEGAQVAVGANIVGGLVDGAQVAAGANIAGAVDGAQVAAGLNVAGDVDGAQVSGGVNIAGDVRGAQIGLLNIAGSVSGAQIGLVNIADHVDGVSFALLPIVRDGYNHLEVWADSSMPLNVGLRVGTPALHALISVGADAVGDAQRCVLRLGGGLGTHITAGPLYVDLDATAHGLAGKGCDFRHYADDEVLGQLRATVGLPLGDALAVYVGLAGNAEVRLEDDDLPRPLLSGDDAETGFSAGDVRVFASLFAGVRIF